MPDLQQSPVQETEVAQPQAAQGGGGLLSTAASVAAAAMAPFSPLGSLLMGSLFGNGQALSWLGLGGGEEEEGGPTTDGPSTGGPTQEGDPQQAGADVPALGENAEVTSDTVRTALAHNPRALTALDRLTADAGFTALTPAQQGDLLAQFQATPNGATAQYLTGIAAYHSNPDKEAGLAAYNNALNPDSGTFRSGGVDYTISNGDLLDASGAVVGNIHTDGTWQLTGAEGRTSVYDNIHDSVHMLEGTGDAQRDLLNLHDADPNGKLTADGMNDTFAGMATETLKDVRRENIDMRAVSGYRSVEEQDRLYAQGRTAPGGRVTNARGGSSWHNYGLAADITFLGANGQPHWNETGEYADLWQRYGELGQQNGLEWGGNWTSIQDKPHLEYHPGRTAGQASSLLPAYRRGGLEGAWDELGIGEQN